MVDHPGGQVKPFSMVKCTEAVLICCLIASTSLHNTSIPIWQPLEDNIRIFLVHAKGVYLRVPLRLKFIINVQQNYLGGSFIPKFKYRYFGRYSPSDYMYMYMYMYIDLISPWD